MAKPKAHDSDYEDEATTARLDLLSAYTMLGRLQLDGLLPYSVEAKVEEAVRAVEPPAGEDGYYYKAPGASTLEGRVSHIENAEATSPVWRVGRALRALSPASSSIASCPAKLPSR